MAKKGYTKIDNDLFRFLYTNDLNASELKVLLFLIRYTKGFNRDTARAGYSFIAKGTGYSEESCRLAIKKLVKIGAVSVEYSAVGSSAQVVKVLYKNLCTLGTRTLGGEVQESLDDKVQELLDQDITKHITNNTLKNNTENSSISEINEPEQELSDEEWDKLWEEGE